MLFAVYVKDRLTRKEVCVGDMLSRAEASEIRRILEKYNACEICLVGFDFKKGKVEYK